MTSPETIIDRAMVDCMQALKGIPWITSEELQELVNTMLEQAWQNALQRTEDIFARGSGDQLLERELFDPHLQADFAWKREEGVTDEDIRWWWNLSAFEQEILVQQEELSRRTLYLSLRAKGYGLETVLSRIWKRHARFGTPDGRQDDDRPLPPELRRRIDAYVQKHQTTLTAWEDRLDGETSFNALVRKEIRAGEL